MNKQNRNHLPKKVSNSSRKHNAEKVYFSKGFTPRYKSYESSVSNREVLDMLSKTQHGRNIAMVADYLGIY